MSVLAGLDSLDDSLGVVVSGNSDNLSVNSVQLFYNIHLVNHI